MISQSLADWRSKEQKFFEEIGVDQRITVLGQNPEFACSLDDTTAGWYYSIEDLERLGVEHVEVAGDEWTPMPPTELVEVCRVSLSELR